MPYLRRRGSPASRPTWLAIEQGRGNLIEYNAVDGVKMAAVHHFARTGVNSNWKDSPYRQYGEKIVDLTEGVHEMLVQYYRGKAACS